MAAKSPTTVRPLSEIIAGMSEGKRQELLRRALACRAATRVWPALTYLERADRNSEVAGRWFEAACWLPWVAFVQAAGLRISEERLSRLKADFNEFRDVSHVSRAAHAAAAAAAAAAADADADAAAAASAVAAAAAAYADAAYADAAAAADADAADAADAAARSASRSDGSINELERLGKQPLWKESFHTSRIWRRVRERFRDWVTRIWGAEWTAAYANRYDRWCEKGIDFQEVIEEVLRRYGGRGPLPGWCADTEAGREEATAWIYRQTRERRVPEFAGVPTEAVLRPAVDALNEEIAGERAAPMIWEAWFTQVHAAGVVKKLRVLHEESESPNAAETSA